MAVFSLAMRLCLALAALLWLAGAAPAAAEDAYILEVSRQGPPERIGVSAELRGAFTQEIRATIDSGAPLAFTYFVELRRHRAVVWDKAEREVAIRRMVKFDTLKKEYLTWEKRGEDEDELTFDAELRKVTPEDKSSPKPAEAAARGAGQNPPPPVLDPVVLKKPEDMRRWMTVLEKFDLGPVDGLPAGGRYYLRVRCEMKSIKLIPPFNILLFFLKFLDFDTPWTESTVFTLTGAEAAPVPAPEPVKGAAPESP